MKASDVLWRPRPERLEASELNRYRNWLGDERAGGDYFDLWRWSTDDLSGFWQSIVDFEGVTLTGSLSGPPAPATMPGGKWFPGRALNFSEHILKRAPETALVVVDDDDTPHPVSRAELLEAVASLAANLTSMGVEPGDRIVAVLPNRAEAVVGLLAAAALGAIWAVCSPEFGSDAILSRFAQLEPKILILTDGYRLGGRAHDRRADMAEVAAGLPTVKEVIWVDHLGQDAGSRLRRPVQSWSTLATGKKTLDFAEVPFDHPLWVLFSSGTTGLPKGIVHGHGGALLELLKMLRLHGELHHGERFLSVASTSWAVWNSLGSSLGLGATAVLLDGSPTRPDLGRVWQVAATHEVGTLGLGAGYVHASLKAGLKPPRGRLQTVLVTGSPLSSEGFDWIYDHFPDVWLTSMSGGTDVCSIFVGGALGLPVRRGRIQAPALGVAVEAWDDNGNRVIRERGELVVTKPMPSMPLCFWNDPDGERYRQAYFDMFPGVWRHGDFIEFDPDGSSVIHGRSDSTLNRHGVRLGPADIYRLVEAIPEVAEALVVGAERGTDYYMPLFVVLTPPADEDDVKARIRKAIREGLSPRHVPDEIIVMRGIPHTRTGKKLEVPVKRLLQGDALSEVVDLGSVDDDALVQEYAAFASDRARTPSA